MNIVDLEINVLKKRIEELGYNINITKGVKQYILDLDSKKDFGARPIKRAIQKEIEDNLSEVLLNNKDDKKKNIEVTLTNIKKKKNIKIEIK